MRHNDDKTQRSAHGHEALAAERMAFHFRHCMRKTTRLRPEQGELRATADSAQLQIIDQIEAFAGTAIDETTCTRRRLQYRSERRKSIGREW